MTTTSQKKYFSRVVQVGCSCNPSAYQSSRALLNCFIIQLFKPQTKESFLALPYRFSTSCGRASVKKIGHYFKIYQRYFFQDPKISFASVAQVSKFR